ncbi:hypothetical protein [Streptomyces sp. Y1]|uniref:DUF2188 domain-containing protein n=1 Tax=Streptomyces sp. Y1 TaxID=3238634 RepID=A0AB39TLM0_9ACTN
MSDIEYIAEVHILTAAGEWLTYYGNTGTTPEEALRSAKAEARGENPNGRIMGHRVRGWKK